MIYVVTDALDRGRVASTTLFIKLEKNVHVQLQVRSPSKQEHRYQSKVTIKHKQK